MTLARFDFQREAVLSATGKVLNIGANDDPGQLKAFNPEVINCDAYTAHHGIDGQVDFDVDCIFNATHDRWPFEDGSVDLVVLGDVVEHWWPFEFEFALTEAHRVANRLCITVPEDHRVEAPGYFEALAQDIADKKTAPGCCHVYAYTADDLKNYLLSAGFHITELQTVDYGFAPVGHFIMAQKVGA